MPWRSRPPHLRRGRRGSRSVARYTVVLVYFAAWDRMTEVTKRSAPCSRVTGPDVKSWSLVATGPLIDAPPPRVTICAGVSRWSPVATAAGIGRSLGTRRSGLLTTAPAGPLANAPGKVVPVATKTTCRDGANVAADTPAAV